MQVPFMSPLCEDIGDSEKSRFPTQMVSESGNLLVHTQARCTVTPRAPYAGPDGPKWGAFGPVFPNGASRLTIPSLAAAEVEPGPASSKSDERPVLAD